MLRFWPLLGPNSHKVALVTGAFVAALWPAGPGMILYLGYDLVLLNVVMAVLILVQRRLDRGVARELAAELAAKELSAGAR
jgi:hypothetical protein